jgi:hypothetical protein
VFVKQKILVIKHCTKSRIIIETGFRQKWVGGLKLVSRTTSDVKNKGNDQEVEFH